MTTKFDRFIRKVLRRIDKLYYHFKAHFSKPNDEIKSRTRNIEEIFDLLISKNETNTLDFKIEFYDFENIDKDKTRDFIIDILAFANTIRDESAYIVFGIRENEATKKNELIGIDKITDISILQEKLKDKITPIPKFELHTVFRNNKTFAILEIFLPDNSLPCKLKRPYKGLSDKAIYLRRSATNTIAKDYEEAKIYHWLEELRLYGTSKKKECQYQWN